MTRQHVFPDRLKRVIPRLDGTRLNSTWDRVTRRGKVIRGDQTTKTNQGSPAHHRIRKVCLACNGGWLKAMEEDCFPLVEQIITGSAPILRREHQIKLARVAMSIAMVGEWIASDHVVTTQAEREAFRSKLEPPHNWFVFIGRDGTGAKNPRFMTDGCTSSAKFDVEAPEKQFTSFTMTMGPVLFHVISCGEHMFLDPDSYARRFGAAPLWPPTDWLNFDIMFAMDTADIRNMRELAGRSMREIILKK